MMCIEFLLADTVMECSPSPSSQHHFRMTTAIKYITSAREIGGLNTEIPFLRIRPYKKEFYFCAFVSVSSILPQILSALHFCRTEKTLSSLFPLTGSNSTSRHKSKKGCAIGHVKPEDCDYYF